jgi:hypothetical protein
VLDLGCHGAQHTILSVAGWRPACFDVGLRISLMLHSMKNQGIEVGQNDRGAQEVRGGRCCGKAA